MRLPTALFTYEIEVCTSKVLSAAPATITLSLLLLSLALFVVTRESGRSSIALAAVVSEAFVFVAINHEQ